MAFPRAILVRVIARNLRLGQPPGDVLIVLTARMPRLTGPERLALVDDAIARNMARHARALAK